MGRLTEALSLFVAAAHIRSIVSVNQLLLGFHQLFHICEFDGLGRLGGRQPASQPDEQQQLTRRRDSMSAPALSRVGRPSTQLLAEASLASERRPWQLRLLEEILELRVELLSLLLRTLGEESLEARVHRRLVQRTTVLYTFGGEAFPSAPLALALGGDFSFVHEDERLRIGR